MTMHDLNCHHATPRYTRRHYVDMADALRYQRPMADDTVEYRAGFYRAVDAIANVFANDNHLFDRDKFLKASGR